ncbi:MAG: hypothetical protein F4238_15175, partial [Gemmatimonadetes bacterium]|nr:hypothetical protein [Gemmatimonadota bacterium]
MSRKSQFSERSPASAPARFTPLFAAVFHLTFGSAASALQDLPASEVRDSAGIRIVENARPADDSRLPWRIGPEPTVSIGEVTGEEAYLLHGADAAVMLPDGRIVVANTGTGEIRVFDAAGVHQATWGRAGGGPG